MNILSKIPLGTKELRYLVFYGCIGVFSATLDYVIFVSLKNSVDWNYQFINCLSTFVGISSSFTLNAFLNFKRTDKLLRRYFSFTGVGLLGLALSAVLLYLMIDIMSYSEEIAKLISIFVVTGLQFLLNRLISFRATKKI